MLNSEQVVFLLDTKQRIPNEIVLLPDSIALTLMGSILIISILIKIILDIKKVK